MSALTMGVIGRSRKADERRVPIHPYHFAQIADGLRRDIKFEHGYGERFGIADETLAELFGEMWPRDRIMNEAGVVLLPKPIATDLAEVREGGVLWGWPHVAQRLENVQAAIDRRLTLIAWESMHMWNGDTPGMHLFYRNNEMAGYCAVQHALELAGADGLYGPPLSAVVLSHGSVSRGAIYALQGRGISDISVYTQRPPWNVHDQIPGCRYGQMVPAADGCNIMTVSETALRRPLLEVLARTDLIVNGILQDTDRPLMFIAPGEEQMLKPRSVIVDVSCDDAMGFSFAKPTTFKSPTFQAGPVTYYAVDHTPSFLWRAASWEISRVVVEYLAPIMGGPAQWKLNETVRRAIEIDAGVVKNLKALRFQNRSAEYPHNVNRPASEL